MDSQNQSNNDDQELAMALASISQDNNNISNEQPTAATMIENAVQTPAGEPVADYIVTPTPTNDVPVSADNKTLEGIRKDALNELRPLVDKLDINAEDKFDICLLLLRSTDDKTLIPAAHEAARNITDEAKRAQALLDVIREIDFLSTPETTI